MKRKYQILSLVFVLILFFMGCADETGQLPGPVLGEEYVQLTMSLGSPHTRAGDPFTTPEEEIEIHSVACFVKTNDNGVPGASGYKQGSFHTFFSDITPGEENGFEEVLKDNGDGTYSITLRIRSSSFTGQTPVIIITNYAENGLASRLKAVREWDDLESFRTEELTETGISCPLLMYARAEVALQYGQSSTQIFNLQRIMSRIDIYNKVPSDAAEPFVLLSARIVSPKLYSYLLPGNDGAYYIPVLPEGFTPKTPGSSDPTKIEGLYTYETANDGSTEHTAVEVTGIFGGEPYTRLIKLLKGNDPVPLGRNTRYQISLDAPPGATEISFTFKIEDWSEGEVIPANPSNEKPNPVNFTFGGEFNPARWNAPEKIYNMENQQSGTISFSVTSKQETITEVVSIFHVPGSEFDVSDIVKGGNIIYNPEGTITQNYTIEFSTAGQLPGKEPVDVYVILKNAIKPTYRDTIWITNLLNYPDAPFKPVWLEGLYWAPVNIRQTVLESSIATNESMGSVFQWGRNTPFNIIPDMPDEMISDGPVLYSVAQANAGKFIVTPTQPGDWLIETETPENINKRNNLWSNGNDNDNPCPAGWRIPTMEELKSILDVYLVDKEYDESKRRFIIPAQDGQTLYFPFAGWITWSNGKGSYMGRILSWSSTLIPDKTKAYYLNIYTDVSQAIHQHELGYAFGVRCVRKE